MAAVDGALRELRPGLWRWTARHPAAVDDPAPESPDDWPPDVGCVACATGRALVFVDPLAPSGERERPLWAEVDALVAEHGPPVRRAGEVMVWLEDHRALVPGDRLLGDGRGGLRMCPPSWYAGLTAPDGLREALRPALDLPIEMVLVSHGEPVLRDGRRALERALEPG